MRSIEAHRRRNESRSAAVQAIPGDEALAQVRPLVLDFEVV
jgi:hypothetical protein